MMAYVFLLIGIISEIFGTAFLKASDGFTKFFPAIGGILGFGISLYFVSLAFKSIPLSVAYATWCGAGIIGAAFIGFFFWKEKISIIGFIGIILIVLGIVFVTISIPSNEKTNVMGIEEKTSEKYLL